jgi:hypothetical protein
MTVPSGAAPDRSESPTGEGVPSTSFDGGVVLVEEKLQCRVGIARRSRRLAPRIGKTLGNDAGPGLALSVHMTRIASLLVLVMPLALAGCFVPASAPYEDRYYANDEPYYVSPPAVVVERPGVVIERPEYRGRRAYTTQYRVSRGQVYARDRRSRASRGHDRHDDHDRHDHHDGHGDHHDHGD